MAKLPNQKRILREDLKEAPNWIERLITPLNSFMESVYYALNKNITFNENIACQIKTINFTTNSDYSTASPVVNGFTQLQFRHSLRTRPQGVIIMQTIKKESSYVAITEAVTLDWYENNGIIYINYISGLEDSQEYDIKLLVI